MKIIVFGATGGTGGQIITQGLNLGHHITAFVRNPKKLTAMQNKRLSVVTGNILDPKSVEDAIKGQDVVISALGNKTSDAFFRSNTIISDALKNIIAGMKKQKVKRILFIASFGVNKNIFLPEKLFIRIVLKNIFADIPLQEELIKKSGLDYTIVHPARLVNESKEDQRYKSGVELPIGIFSKITRVDVADFILKNLHSKTLIGKTITISY